MKNRPTPPPPPPKVRFPRSLLLSEDAREEWIRINHLLKGKTDDRDENLLIDYCNTHSEIIRLRAEVDAAGECLMGPKGGMYINPLLNILISRQSHLASLRRDLYFTPKSRIEKQNRASMSKTKGIRANLEQDDGTND